MARRSREEILDELINNGLDREDETGEQILPRTSSGEIDTDKLESMLDDAAADRKKAESKGKGGSHVGLSDQVLYDLEFETSRGAARRRKKDLRDLAEDEGFDLTDEQKDNLTGKTQKDLQKMGKAEYDELLEENGIDLAELYARKKRELGSSQAAREWFSHNVYGS